MRICELLSLKLQDINFKERTVIIRKSAKTGKGRVVYMSDDAYKALQKRIKIRDSKRKHLFYSRCRESMSYETSRSSFIKCLRKGYTLHCLRHTFASELLSDGMPLESLQILIMINN